MDATLSTLKACVCGPTPHLRQLPRTVTLACTHSLKDAAIPSARSHKAHWTSADHREARRHLALSTNNIEKISSLTGMENLRILSLGRNCIKKIENLEGVADTLEQLWISYNQIEKLVGIDKLTNLKVLYLANNKVKDWSEIDRLSTLDKLEDLLLRACPIYDEHAASLPTYRVEVRVPAGSGAACGAVRACVGGWRLRYALVAWCEGGGGVQVLKRVPALNKLDGVPIDVDERDAANAGG